jgi:hypothetical protein
MTTAAEVSEDLLAAFDNIVNAGATLPLDELKSRFKNSDHFRYSEFKLYREVISLPVTVGMITGEKSDAVNKIIEGLQQLHGDELLFTFNGTGDEGTLTVRVWKDEDALRGLWKDFAEDEYKSEMLGGGK